MTANTAMKSELRTYEIRSSVFSSFLPPFVTHGMVGPRVVEMERRGYNEVTIESYGNVWTRTIPLNDPVPIATEPAISGGFALPRRKRGHPA